MEPALSNIRVLDLTQLLPGALCTLILADLGAEVIKIEKPHGGDPFRQTPPIRGDMGAYFRILNRNKKSVTINIHDEKGREVLLKLIPKTDVIIESFRPGMMDRLGLSYEKLAAINPRIIYCALTGFGQYGPDAAQPSHDINLLALSGILDLIGTMNGPPVVPPIQIAGAGGGIQAALGIVTALLGRERTGFGQRLDVALLDCLTPFLYLATAEQDSYEDLIRRGETHVGGGSACYNVYETKDGRYIALGCLEERFWCNLCKALDVPEMVSELHAPPPRQQEMMARLRRIFLTRERDEWLMLLRENGVLVSPVNTLREAFAYPQTLDRGLAYEAMDTDGCVAVHYRSPLKHRGADPLPHISPPRLGEHTRMILSEAGIGEEVVNALERRGVI